MQFIKCQLPCFKNCLPLNLAIFLNMYQFQVILCCKILHTLLLLLFLKICTNLAYILMFSKMYNFECHLPLLQEMSPLELSHFLQKYLSFCIMNEKGRGMKSHSVTSCLICHLHILLIWKSLKLGKVFMNSLHHMPIWALPIEQQTKI